MDKQKQIEEMARDFGNAQYRCNEDSPCCKECILGGDCIPYEYARVAYNAGYRKIPELPKDAVLTADDIAELLTIVARDTRKETAEKLAEKLKAKLNEWLEDNEDLNGKIDFGIAMIELIGVKSLDGEVIAESLIDEICKEITEGKVKE